MRTKVDSLCGNPMLAVLQTCYKVESAPQADHARWGL